MPKNLHGTLKNERIQHLTKRPPVMVPSGTPLKTVLETLKQQRRGCVIVQSNHKVIGLFTERDLLTRVIEPRLSLQTPIDQVMTPNPMTLPLTASVAEAIQLMSQKGYRNIPMVDEQGGVQGIISVRDILKFLAEHFPYEVYNLPPDLHQINRAREGA